MHNLISFKHYSEQDNNGSLGYCVILGQVRINNPDQNKPPLFTTPKIGKDNAIARHGIHGLYWLFSIKIPSSFIQVGDNTIFLTQSRNSFSFAGVMYDYLRLEGPPTS